jgi:pimeloyl-ACP methyl ester carboxylesterase
MVNQLRSEMPRPLVGIGHSFGGAILVQVALMHPRLFSTLVLLDPVMQYKGAGPATGTDPLALSAVRRDLWPSREAAAAAFHKSKFYAPWDRRVLDAWIRHGVREVPTSLYPDAPAGSVTLVSTKHMEVFTYLRPTYQAIDARTGRRFFDRSKIPDVSDAGLAVVGPGRLYRPEVPNVALALPQLRPGVLWIFGGTSMSSPPELRREKMELTGIGVGGSGGAKAGRVKEFVLEGVGHLVCMDKPNECATQAASWIGPEVERWREEERELESWWRKSAKEKQIIDEEWQSFIVKPKAGAKL